MAPSASQLCVPYSGLQTFPGPPHRNIGSRASCARECWPGPFRGLARPESGKIGGSTRRHNKGSVRKFLEGRRRVGSRDMKRRVYCESCIVVVGAASRCSQIGQTVQTLRLGAHGLWAWHIVEFLQCHPHSIHGFFMLQVSPFRPFETCYAFRVAYS